MNVLIVEDEAHTAELLQEIIEQDSDFIVLEKLESISETVQFLSKYQQNLDVLFFDIQLADGQSFEIFRHIDVVVPIVFCTAYDEYTLQAIKNNGIDYILKPFKESEIHEALQKYKKLLSKLRAKISSPVHFQAREKQGFQKVFLTHFREKTVVVRVDDIALFSVENETVYLYTFEGKKYPLFKKLEYIESVCDPDQFFRINRQMLVNQKAVLSFEQYFNRKILIELNINIKQKPVVSRLKVASFKEWLLKTVLLIAVATLALGCGGEGQSTVVEHTDNLELRELYENDQAERSVAPIDWAVLNVADSLRRVRVMEIREEGGIKTANDYHHAAMVFQHGSDTTAIGIAYRFAREAVRIDADHTGAKWLMAAAWDRHKMYAGEPQWYGTQYVTDGPDTPWRLYDIDTTKVTDEDRAKFGVPSLAEARARASTF